jgi:hypothetical protein
MSTTTVTAIRSSAKKPGRVRKAKAEGPDVELLAQAADVITFVSKVYEEAD